MRMLWVLLMAVLVLTAVLPATAQAVRVVAVVDFVDETSDGRLIGASRLSGDLQHELEALAGGRLRVVSVETVRGAMTARGYGTREIFNTTKLMEIAAATGADWIVTGRWMHLDTDWVTIERPGSERPLFRYAVGNAMIEIRVIEAPSRRVILADSFSATVQGFAPVLVVLEAVRSVLRQVAVSIVRTAP